MQARGLQAEHTQHDVAHVAERGIGDELFVLRLAQCQHRAVDDAGRGQQHDVGRGPGGHVGAQRHGQLDEAEGAHLGHHTGQQRGARGRGLAVGQRQPGMEGEDRALDEAGQKDGRKHEKLRARAQVQAVERGEVEGPVARLLQPLHAQHDDGSQEQHAAGHGVEEEGDGRAFALGPAEDQDQQHHGHQRGFPQDEQHQQVLRQEGAQQPGLQRQQQAQVEAAFAFARVPGAKQHGGKQQCRQQQQVDVEAVDREMQADAERGHPGHIQRVACGAVCGVRAVCAACVGHTVKAHEGLQREGQHRQHDRQRQGARQRRCAHEGHEGGARGRQQQHGGQGGGVSHGGLRSPAPAPGR